MIKHAAFVRDRAQLRSARLVQSEQFCSDAVERGGIRNGLGAAM